MASNKKTRGRQKIEMKRIENEDDRLITFSKRRSGIYKKASELVTLTGAEVAFVVFSPAGKPFSFAHPSVEHVANKFLEREPPPQDSTHPLVEAHRQLRIHELNQQHNELIRQLDAEKEKGQQLKQRMKGVDTKGWWDTPVEEQNLQELLQMETAFQELHINLTKKIKEKADGASCSYPAHAPPMDPHDLQLANPFALDANKPDHPVDPHVQMTNPFALDPDANRNDPSMFFPGGHGGEKF